jgi:hypothetical protein
MILILAVWVYMFILALIFGWKVVDICKSTFRSLDNYYPNISLMVLFGFSIVTSLATFISLLMRIGLTANLIFLILGLLILVLDKRKLITSIQLVIKSYDLKFYILATILLAGTLMLSTIQQPIYDTGLYHLQSIKWINEFGTVLGLGNLHGRLAFNSAIFIPSALFGFSFLVGEPIPVVSGFIFIISNLFFLERFLPKNKKISLSNIVSGIAVIQSLIIYSNDVSSFSTDLGAGLLTWVVLVISIEKLEKAEIRRFDIDSMLIIFLSVFTITMKISSLPIILLPIYLIIFNVDQLGGRLRSLIVLLIILFILTPWVSRGISLSGYLIYPFVDLDVIEVDWKIPKYIGLNDRDWISSWSRIPQHDKSEVLEMAMSDWLPIWLNNQGYIDILFLFTGCLGTLLLILLTVKKMVLDRYNKQIVDKFVLLAIIGIGLIFWFFLAPDVRFGYGFIGVASNLTLSKMIYASINAFARLSNYHFPNPFFVIIMLWGLSIFFHFIILSVNNPHLAIERLNHPRGSPQVDVKYEVINGVEIYNPTKGDQCWNSRLPCTPILNNNLVLRGDKLHDGFRISYAR